ncbi:TRAP transporter small permease subunit [Propylenella binzhouense]|uniref:TRAP transporter small permease protein n=1 Tax=Propylenella binzhouense TaxID=2555902 RepID=A0A964T0T7_9HYPH|nr:TRAP transporter small permease [Propylenella binzhouense]MYZ46225.1 TRAP transporter small permease [Propylenella binzhouense]
MLAVNGLRWLARLLSLAGAVGAAVAIVLIVAVILVEVVLRTLFATSTFMSDELVGYLVAAVGFLPLGYAFATGGILRVNLLLNMVQARPRLRMAIELGCVAATLAVVGLLVWYLWGNVARQYTRGYTSGTMSGIPQWIPTGVMLLGIAIFWLQVFVYGLGLVTSTERLLVESQDETAVT